MKLPVLLLSLTVLLSFDAQAIRCNNKVVGKGDNQYRFQKLCGRPDFVQRQVVYVTDSITAKQYGNMRYHSHEEDQNQATGIDIQPINVPNVGHGHLVSNTRRSHDVVEVSHEHERQVIIETWTYDFGSNRLVQEVRFVDGVAVSIRNRGYGID